MNHVGLICHGGAATGNERYMVELIRALLRREDRLQYTIFYTHEATRAQLDGHGRGARFYRLRPNAAWIRAALVLPWAIRRSGVMLIHGQYGLPPLTSIPAVLTVHDIFVARRPDMYPTVHRLQLLYRIPRALESARRVIVPSQFTKQDILSRYQTDPAKVEVIPLGVSDRFRRLSSPELERVRDRLHLPEHFVLYVGALQPRKNLARLVAAFGGLPSELRRTYPLLIAGPQGWMYDDLQRAVEPLAHEGTVRFLGYVSDEEVPAIMNLATIFAFPSLSEGFGFPAVEALRCGACVLAGRAGSLPEIVSDAGLLVDPLDTEDIRRGLASLLENPVLRAELRQRSERRAASYTWDRTAEATAAVYHEVLHMSGPTGRERVPCPA